MIKDIFGHDGYDLPDPLAMSVFLDKEIIAEDVVANIRVDTRDGMTRGGCVIDFFNLEPEAEKVRIVQRCHQDMFYNLLKKSLN
jgi:inosine-uridine nucleoside N-ribohydrolase